MINRFICDGARGGEKSCARKKGENCGKFRKTRKRVDGVELE